MSATERVTGYRLAFQELGLKVGEELIFHDAFTFEGGYRMAKLALALVPRPTALFAANNRISFATFRALQDAGLEVPEDISLVGFDGLPIEATEHPFLTVAEHSPYDMGRRAAELLMARMSGQAPEGYQEIVTPVNVIYRESAGPCITEK
jgi:LacI family transcriptional regulator